MTEESAIALETLLPAQILWLASGEIADIPNCVTGWKDRQGLGLLNSRSARVHSKENTAQQVPPLFVLGEKKALFHILSKMGEGRVSLVLRGSVLKTWEWVSHSSISNKTKEGN